MCDAKKMSFVIPCYRSELTILKVVDEIEETMGKKPDMDFEIILVNDGSPDQVWQVIQERSRKDEHVIGINLAKNFGQHSALMAGYNYVTGDYIVSLDDDGQTPADEVFLLIDELEKGYDVVYGTYPKTHQSIFRRLGSAMAKKMSDFIFDFRGNIHATSYFVARNFVISEMIKYNHSFPYLTGLIVRVTHNISSVPVHHRDRLEGKSGYSFKSLLSLWLNGFTAFSVKPLEISAYLGFLLSAGGFIFAIVTIIRKILQPSLVAGWSSIFSALLIIGGMIMVMLGLIGEYIGRIYICINNSPQFVVKEISSKKEDKEK